MGRNSYSEFLQAANLAACKKGHSNAKHYVVNYVWDNEKNKYVKSKRFRKHSGMTKKELKEFYGHTFSFKPVRNFIEDKNTHIMMLFDKNDQLYDVFPIDGAPEETEALAKGFLNQYKGTPYKLMKSN